MHLGDPRAHDPAVVGAKAAALARAKRAGLPVLPGAVVPVGMPAAELVPAMNGAWTVLCADSGALAVRSSSPVEDSATESLAGQFSTVLDVGSAAAVAAAEMVLASAAGAPMAVLLQPMVDAATGGVLFGLDPVSGRTDRFLVEAVDGSPAPLVGGEVTGVRLELSRSGRRVGGARGLLSRAQRRTLAAAARAAADVFGGPQDIEWAFDRRGRFWLLQSRPVTAVASRAVPTGPVFGPGPVAETLPGALAPLEEDLWVAPLREGVAGALEVVGAVSARRLAREQVVVTVGGRVAANLELLGVRQPAGRLRRFDPRPPARRLAAAWRVGRLRQAMPLLAAGVVERIDADLAAVPRLDEPDDEALVDLVAGARGMLQATHGHEVLAGILGDGDGPTAAAAALAALAAGRHGAMDDVALVAAHPEVLALSGPRIGGGAPLPGEVGVVARATVGELPPREALRLRARWLQELLARAAEELGDRLRARGVLSDRDLVRWLRHDELVAAVSGEPLPADLADRAAAAPAPPLPAAFRFTADGTVVAVDTGERAGQGAGGGRVSGTVVHLTDGPPPAGAVLVVGDLEPGLAAWLPSVGAVVAESGSVLSHLAIVAREFGVATVVGVAEARQRFPVGAEVLVDGTTGEVRRLDGATS